MALAISKGRLGAARIGRGVGEADLDFLVLVEVAPVVLVRREEVWREDVPTVRDNRRDCFGFGSGDWRVFICYLPLVDNYFVSLEVEMKCQELEVGRIYW